MGEGGVTPISAKGFLAKRFSAKGVGGPVLKLNLVPNPHILGQFGPPKKRGNFGICNRHRGEQWSFSWSDGMGRFSSARTIGISPVR